MTLPLQGTKNTCTHSKQRSPELIPKHVYAWTRAGDSVTCHFKTMCEPRTDCLKEDVNGLLIFPIMRREVVWNIGLIFMM